MYKVIPTPKFNSDVEYYFKKRKYHNIGNDIKQITDELKKGNLVGDELSDLKIERNGHTYKVRAANTDARVGKSNGYRIIYYVIKDDKEIYLLTIYSKKDDNSIPSDKEIAKIVKDYVLNYEAV